MTGTAEPRPEAERPRARRPAKEALQVLRGEARNCEARVTKLEEMREKLAKKLSDPALYDDARIGEMEVWQKKYAEVMGALDRAEALWVTALEKLEQAET